MLDAGPFADIRKISGVAGVLLEVLHGDQIAGASHAGLPRERLAHDHFGRYGYIHAMHGGERQFAFLFVSKRTSS